MKKLRLLLYYLPGHVLFSACNGNESSTETARIQHDQFRYGHNE